MMKKVIITYSGGRGRNYRGKRGRKGYKGGRRGYKGKGKW